MPAAYLLITSTLIADSAFPPISPSKTDPELPHADESSVPRTESISSIRINRTSTGITITFDGILQTASNIHGPWIDVESPQKPYPLTDLAAQAFFRSRPSDELFGPSEILALTLSGPLQQHFDFAFAGLPDGIFPPVREKPYFDATAGIYGRQVPIQLRVRGNSSLQECPFPKLKIKVSKKNREDTPFADAREVKIATHCAEGGRGNIGRLREEIATFREALAYEVMEILDFLTPRVRRAQITYHDSGPALSDPAPEEVGEWPVTRQAMILEHVEVLAERLGGRALEAEEVAQLNPVGFEPQLAVDLQLLYVLLGNWDFELTQEGFRLWNLDVIELARGNRTLVAGDFDLASWVTEEVLLSVPHDYLPELPDLDRQMTFDLERIRERESRAHFTAAANHFLARRDALEAHVLAATVDEPGRANALKHITTFYEILTSLSTIP